MNDYVTSVDATLAEVTTTAATIQNNNKLIIELAGNLVNSSLGTGEVLRHWDDSAPFRRLNINPGSAQTSTSNFGFAITSGGTLTIVNGTITNLDWIDGSGSLPTRTASRTLAYNSIVTLRKVSDTTWQIWGNGIT